MNRTSKNTFRYLLLLLLTVVLFLMDISFGSVYIPLKEVFTALTGGKGTQAAWDYIILQYRLPKAVTAMLAGMGLSISGLLMQTLFRNPLAGPYVLGLSSGSSLAVALLILGSGVCAPALNEVFVSSYGMILASCMGSTLVLMAVLLVSQRMKDTMAILIVGLMFGSFTNAFVGILAYFSSAEQLQKFTFWSMGNLGNLSWDAVGILSVAVIVGLLIAIACLKPLDALLLGENYAKSLGMDYKKSKLLIILSTSILAGSITAFAGPIAFIGLAVPHLAKLVFHTSHHLVLFWGTLLMGAGLMLCCDLLSQVPGFNFTLPINAITSIIGAPVVIWLLMRKQKMIN